MATGVAALAIGAVVVAAAVGSPPSLSPGTEEPTAGPDVEFEFSPSKESVTVKHAGGSSIDTGDLYVDVEGGRNETWVSRDPDLQRGDPIEAGEKVVVTGVSSGTTIRLVWTNPDGTKAVLETYTVQ